MNSQIVKIVDLMLSKIKSINFSILVGLYHFMKIITIYNMLKKLITLMIDFNKAILLI